MTAEKTQLVRDGQTLEGLTRFWEDPWSVATFLKGNQINNLCIVTLRSSQKVTASWGYHPFARNCLSQRGLRHGRTQANSIMLWLRAVSLPIPTPPFLSQKWWALCPNDSRKFRTRKKPTGPDLYGYIVGMVLCWAGINKICYCCWAYLWRKPPGCLLEQRIRHGLQRVGFLGLWLVVTSKWGLCTEGGTENIGDQSVIWPQMFLLLACFLFWVWQIVSGGRIPLRKVKNQWAFLLLKHYLSVSFTALCFTRVKTSRGREVARMGDRTPSKPAGLVLPCPDVSVLSSCKTTDISILS